MSFVVSLALTLLLEGSWLQLLPKDCCLQDSVKGLEGHGFFLCLPMPFPFHLDL